MTLAEYVDKGGRGTIVRIHEASGVAQSTIYYCARHGRPLERLSTARKVSAATGHEVSVAELMGLTEQERE